MRFYTFYTKEYTPELVKMCILISKKLGIDALYDFLDLCASMRDIFEEYFKPVLAKPIPELERAMTAQLKDLDSKMSKDLMEGLYLDAFKRANEKNRFRFEGKHRIENCKNLGHVENP